MTIEAIEPENTSAYEASAAVVGVDVDELRGEMLELCRKLAPIDLQLQRLYIVFRSEMSDILTADGSAGIAGGPMDLVARAAIGERYEGRGRCFIVNDTCLTRVADDIAGFVKELGYQPSAEYLRGLVRREARSITLHELAHTLDKPFDPREVDPQTLAMEVRSTVDVWTGATPSSGPNDSIPFRGHGWEYIRCLSHLVYRAEKLDVRIGSASIYHHDQYQLSPLSTYMTALGDELRTFQDQTFEAIRQAIPPKAFRDLWHYDVISWMDSDPSLSQIRRDYGGITFPRIAAEESEVIRAIPDGYERETRNSPDALSSRVLSANTIRLNESDVNEK